MVQISIVPLDLVSLQDVPNMDPHFRNLRKIMIHLVLDKQLYTTILWSLKEYEFLERSRANILTLARYEPTIHLGVYVRLIRLSLMHPYLSGLHYDLGMIVGTTVSENIL